MSNVLLIGNGPSALEKQLGDLIDSDKFDYVVRFNRWNYDEDGTKFTGFEKFVGTRCDIWIVNDLHLYESRLATRFGSKYSKVLVVIPKFKFNYLNKSFESIKKQYSFIDFIPPEYEDSINSIVDFSPKWPTTGLVGIHFAINHFEKVFLYGFDCYDIRYSGMHYFEDENAKFGANKFRSGNHIDHAPQKDKQYISYILEKYNVEML